jgi:cyclopropane-fatty-acyl-phospholipid synthase
MDGGETVSDPALSPPASANPADRRLRRLVRLARLIRAGTLTLVLNDGSRHRVSAAPGPSATIVLKDLRAVRRLLVGGSLGLAEAYVDGMWESPDIRAVMALAAANEAEWVQLLHGRMTTRLFAHVLHQLRPNTRRGARRNIVEHYDLGNDFYAAWLDPSMTYSSGLFDGSDDSLEGAQLRKIHRLCQALDLRTGLRLLEVGCGWGAFAEVAARDYGCNVLGITLSPSQLEYARARIARAGLSERVELRLQDYRDVPGRFDRIASIEMFEAVGERYWPAFFAALRERLLPGGIAGLQVITIGDRWFEDYRRKADFIQRHIFPGGMLPSPSRLRQEIARAGLKWREAHWFGGDYAETLSRWQTRFQNAWPNIAASTRLRDARFKRLWEYYLAYCETGFRAGWTDVGQILLARNN